MTREKNFHLHHALSDIVAQLSAFQAAAYQMVEQDQHKSEEE